MTNEPDLVAWLQQQAGVSRSGLVLGIGDDCAIFRPRAGEDLVFTTDQFIENVHFTHAASAAKLGARALARSLSDIAAMGATPRFCLVSLAIAKGTTDIWIKSFFRGLIGLAKTHGTVLAGGDLAQDTKTHADVMVCGSVSRGKALRRDGARPGDAIYVSGPLGKGWDRPIQPRLELGQQLLGRATSCIDLSDGLSLDLRRVCEASGVAAELDRVPIAKGSTLERALHLGEDYELLFTLPKGNRAPAGTTRVGAMVRGKAGDILLNGEPLEPRGYDHFKV
jgi:thiamine-monophosphate kinase